MYRYLSSFEEPPLSTFKWHDSAIYQDFGVKQEYTISLCGDAGVGKKTFLTIFINVRHPITFLTHVVTNTIELESDSTRFQACRITGISL